MVVGAASGERIDDRALAVECVAVGLGMTLAGGAFAPPAAAVFAGVAIALLIVGLVLLPAARVLVRSRLSYAVLAFAAWWTASGLAHHDGMAAMRLAPGMVGSVAAYVVVGALTTRGRELVAAGFLGGAAILAGTGLIDVSVAMAAGRGPFDSWLLTDERSVRLAGPLHYPEAFALWLSFSFLAGALVRTRRVQPLVSLSQVVVGCGILASESRGALVAFAAALIVAGRRLSRATRNAVVALAVCAPLVLAAQRLAGATAVLYPLSLAAAVLTVLLIGRGLLVLGRLDQRPANRWRDRVMAAVLRLRWLIGGVWLVTTCGLLVTQRRWVDGLDPSWWQRLRVAKAAIHLISGHVWSGLGPDPVFRAPTATGVPGWAYFTHNEFLEIALSLGIPGLVAVVALAAWVAWRLRPHRIGLAVLAAVVVAGLFDFGWHFPVLGWVAASVAACEVGQRRLRRQPFGVWCARNCRRVVKSCTLAG
ncbi:MAG: O-antigen ligase family protein [Acidothermus cellulolyticus]|nr:O-antigen ligase family protein [Acidothermus cellulolyticus]